MAFNFEDSFSDFSDIDSMEYFDGSSNLADLDDYPNSLDWHHATAQQIVFHCRHAIHTTALPVMPQPFVPFYEELQSLYNIYHDLWPQDPQPERRELPSGDVALLRCHQCIVQGPMCLRILALSTVIEQVFNSDHATSYHLRFTFKDALDDQHPLVRRLFIVNNLSKQLTTKPFNLMTPEYVLKALCVYAEKLQGYLDLLRQNPPSYRAKRTPELIEEANTNWHDMRQKIDACLRGWKRIA
jgi:hypothetical protein